MKTHLDLFSGIGGFALAAKWAGFETVAFCEIEDYPRKVLEKNFPGVPIHRDIRELDGEEYAGTTLITGGYPCQPFSLAGKRGGAEDDRHLWPEMFRIVKQARPDWVVAENVFGHINMGLDQVLSDLEGEGYSCRPVVIPACAVDAPHRRDRVWIIANARSEQYQSGGDAEQWERTEELSERPHANAISTGERSHAGAHGRSEDECEELQQKDREALPDDYIKVCEALADTKGERRGEEGEFRCHEQAQRITSSSKNVPNPADDQRLAQRESQPGDDGEEQQAVVRAGWWAVEPGVCQLSDGLSEELDKGGLDANKRWVQISCQETARDMLRELRKHKDTLRSPQRRGLGKQQPIEFADAVQFVSHSIASCTGRHPSGERQAAMHGLRKGILSVNGKPLQYSQNEMEKAWESIAEEEKDWAIVASRFGCFWSEWPGVSRIAKEIPRRVDRLKGLGNAIVPQVAYQILRLL